MAYLAPIHWPSSIRQAIKLRFLSPDEECLVVAKANRLEIYVPTTDGLLLSHTRSIYGKILMLEKLQPANSSTEHLFIGTDHFKYFTVSWDCHSHQLHTESQYTDVADKTSRDSQTHDRCLIDPTKQFMTLQIYDGIVTVIPIAQPGKRKGIPEAGTLGEPVAARISDLFVRSSAFVHSRGGKDSRQIKLAFLYEDNHRKACLSIRVLDHSPGGSGEQGNVTLEEVIETRDDLELGASHLIPVPAPAYGLLILAETSITYINESSGESLTEPLKEASLFVAWEQVDAQRWLLADDYGKLYFLMLLLGDNDQLTGWKLDLIGHTSRASVLIYLDNGHVFIGSHQGDSQVIRLLEKQIEVVQTLPNIAPILDFTIMDMGSRAGESQTSEFSSGQARIVAGSGAFQDGSLRSIRSGVGLEEQGLLGEMDHITDLFGLQSTSESQYMDLLLASFVDETRVFQFAADGEIEEAAEYKSLSLSENTLLAINVPNDRLLQVTGSSARVIDAENGMLTSEWSSPDGQSITAASANDHRLALSIGGIEALILDLDGDLLVRARRNFTYEGQIACIHVPMGPTDVCFAGFWESATVSIFKIDTLETIRSVIMSDDGISIPRSILLTQVLSEQPPTLFIAMTNGEVVTFSYDTARPSLSAKKAIVLGTEQANFKALPKGNGIFSVFATCEHPSLIYGYENRIIYSAITAEKASCVCPFNSEAYPGSIAISTAKDLKIALVDTERTTHVQTLPVHETVRRVQYSPTLKAFGLGTIQRTLRAGNEVVQSHFKLADEVLFKELDTYDLNEEELVESVCRADLREESGAIVERFIVGTTYMDDHDEAIRGRILVFAVGEHRMLRVVAQLPVKGACRAVGVVDGNIVAALVKTVVVYSLSDRTLQKKASFRTSTAPIDIAITGNIIAIADLMKSVSIVEYKRGTAGLPDTLEEVARHFQTVWATTVAEVGKDAAFLESDAEGNLMVLQQNTNGITADDRRRMEVISEIRLGEMVNRIRSFDVSANPNAIVTPTAFIGTVEGSIYLIALIAPAYLDTLMRLQSALASLVRSPGNIPFNSYRAFRNQARQAEEPFRFVDGELVDAFLDLSPAVQEEVVKGLGKGAGAGDVEAVRGVVEGLRRLH